MESKDQVVIRVDDRETEDKGEMNASNPQAESAPRHYSDETKKLASYMEDKVSMRRAMGYCEILCIYKVPENHRNKNLDAYNPRIVSIGPLHRDKSHVQAMEEHKLRYLTHFLNISRLSMAQLAEYVHAWDSVVRLAYEETYIRDKAIFSQVILLDGVFVVELFLKNHFPEMREKGDMIFENRWVSNDVLHDLLLLENQIPMMYLCELYQRFVYENLRKFSDGGTNSSHIPSFRELAHEYFKDVCNTGRLKLDPNPRHLAFNESVDGRPWWFLGREPTEVHLVEFLAVLHKPSSARQTVEKPKPEFARCSTAAALRAAGVKFRRGSEDCIFDVRFENGELIIPQLVINDFTETFFRNLIALEQSVYSPKYITSYVILLDNLIDTQKDVHLLIKHGIIENRLGSPEQVVEVFNNLYKEFVADPEEFYFAKLCSELNDYSRDWRHKWNYQYVKWMLRRDYFGTLVAAGSFLLVLTVILTVVSVVQFSLQLSR